MPPTKTTTSLAATRVTYSTTTPFATVESRLRASIQSTPSTSTTGTQPASTWPSIVASLASSTNLRADFATAVQDAVGPHGFMSFYTVDHGAWLPIFSPATSRSRKTGQALKVKRFVLGNPLVAITMLEHDVDAGLFVPVELAVVEDEEGNGCRVYYVRPSSLIAGYEGAKTELLSAARRLDEKLEALVKDVVREEEKEEERRGTL